LSKNVWLVNVGTQKDTSRRAVEIANEYAEGVYAAVGLHPVHTEKSFHDLKELGADNITREFTSRGENFDIDYYKSLAANKKVVAIGECGLDYYRLGDSTKNRQSEAFTAQIALAREAGKPLMIHCRSGVAERVSPHNGAGRDAFSDLIGILKSEKLPERPGIIHFFSGTKGDARELLDMGFCFTFGGVITFAHDYDEVIEMIPMDRILSETDAPYVTPVPYRGKRNEPAYVVEVVKKLSEIKKRTLLEMADIIFENAKRVFLF
ncbi:MAG: TatD family hydrolase, partial [Patescibacteria group bacterium]